MASVETIPTGCGKKIKKVSWKMMSPCECYKGENPAIMDLCPICTTLPTTDIEDEDKAETCTVDVKQGAPPEEMTYHEWYVLLAKAKAARKAEKASSPPKEDDDDDDDDDNFDYDSDATTISMPGRSNDDEYDSDDTNATSPIKIVFAHD